LRLYPSCSFSIVAFASSGSTVQPARIWITDVTIISPENLDQVEKGSVLIENGRTRRVERNQTAKKPADAAVISGKGQYLIPGLMDCTYIWVIFRGWFPTT
jgi:imidazolonepropionase-like amidohydrolase